MPPEMWKGTIHVNSDQYSFAITYAELRLGRRPFAATNQFELQQQHLSGTPDLEGLSEAEQRVLRRALARKPDERYPNCVAFVEALAEAVFPPPKPEAAAPAGPGMARVLAAVVGVGLMLALVLLWVLSPRPNPAPPPEKPKANWLPRGWTPVGDEMVTDRNNHRFFRYIEREFGGQKIIMIAIPGDNPDDPATYYIMEDKVSNAQFQAVMNDPEGQARLAQLREQTQGQELMPFGSWKEGARAGGKNLGVKGRGDYAVYNVTVLEAHCFAVSLGGRLPSWKQWVRATGYPKDLGKRKGPFEGQATDKSGLAVNLAAEGPWPLGKAVRDRSSLGVRGLASNGREWTRTMAGEGSREAPILNKPIDRQELVVLGGKSYQSDMGPWKFSEVEDKDSWNYFETQNDISFRVVLEDR
jgi:hypothetical protein